MNGYQTGNMQIDLRQEVVAERLAENRVVRQIDGPSRGFEEELTRRLVAHTGSWRSIHSKTASERRMGVENCNPSAAASATVARAPSTATFHK